ncbi:MAG: hypothetical protein JEZ02_10295 [Desulfatibacillum sp.]|nr:hypothetical protein [Desulfatibacillum sp.]
MSKDVNNPPALVAQETGAWCFAAAEQMARAYFGLLPISQYEIAYNSLMGLVAAQAPPHFNQWNIASMADLLANITTNITPTQVAQSGQPPNPLSQRVALVRATYGAFNNVPFNGSISNVCTPGNFRADIEANKIVVIGNAIHYYIVYGYDDRDGFVLKVRDPWPPGVGGQATTIDYDTFNAWASKVAIRF